MNETKREWLIFIELHIKVPQQIKLFSVEQNMH